MTETIDEAKLDGLIGKVVGDVAGAMSLFLAYIGDQAGVFAALDGEEYVVYSPISADQFYLGTEDVLHKSGVDVRLGSGAFAAER